MVSIAKIVAALVIVLVAITGLFSALTFPRAVTDFQVSFSVGATREQRQFEVPFLHDEIQVEVTINSGSALWRASITNAEGTEIWSHSATQGDQTTYHSNWIATMPSGRYNLTFGTIGLGGLQANVKVISKGGFW